MYGTHEELQQRQFQSFKMLSPEGHYMFIIGKIIVISII